MPGTKSVAELCSEHQVSADDLIARSGLDAMRVAAIIEGRWTPSPRERERIAAVFELQPADVSWGHKTPIQHIWGQGPA
ncbi:MAG: hypothetical protein KDA41_13105 [Planctomycetales bacterium]|nr:hypothetical protein [Planctomycetales bacterium]